MTAPPPMPVPRVIISTSSTPRAEPSDVLGPACRRGVVDDHRGGPLRPALGQLVADIDPVHVVEVGAEVRHPVAVHHARQADAQRQGPGVARRARGPGGGGQDGVDQLVGVGRGGQLVELFYLAIGAQADGEQLRTADVDANAGAAGTRPEGGGDALKATILWARPSSTVNVAPEAQGLAEPGEAVQGHRRRRRHIERIDARGHGYAHRPAHPEHGGAQARALGADHDGDPFAPQLLGDGVEAVGARAGRERHQGEPAVGHDGRATRARG